MRQIYGIDLSKEKFDVNFFDERRKEQHLVVKNDLNNIAEFLASISREALVVALTMTISIYMPWWANTLVHGSQAGISIVELITELLDNHYFISHR